MISPADLNKNAPFEHFKRGILQKYPEVKNLQVEPWSDRIQPVDYLDERGHDRKEYPPRVTWRVGDTRFSWAPTPSFKEEKWRIFIFSGSTIRPHYDLSLLDTLAELIDISVKPKEERERLMKEFNFRQQF